MSQSFTHQTINCIWDDTLCCAAELWVATDIHSTLGPLASQEFQFLNDATKTHSLLNSGVFFCLAMANVNAWARINNILACNSRRNGFISWQVGWEFDLLP